MVNIIDYINVCSDALLCVIDNDISIDEYLFVDLSNKQIKESFEFYLKSQLYAKYQYGNFNVVINSCQPLNNWRYNKQTTSKYVLTDSSIKVDINQLNIVSEKLFQNLKLDTSKFKFVVIDDVSIYDVVTVIDKIIGNNYLLNNSKFSILQDGNISLQCSKHLPNYIFQNIETVLKDLKII